eukprot:scaffold60784_cov48-Phaeocystis_antarctica.AAC.1
MAPIVDGRFVVTKAPKSDTNSLQPKRAANGALGVPSAALAITRPGALSWVNSRAASLATSAPSRDAF